MRLLVALLWCRLAAPHANVTTVHLSIPFEDGARTLVWRRAAESAKEACARFAAEQGLNGDVLPDLEALVDNWQERTVNCKYAEVNRGLLETSAKQELLVESTKNALVVKNSKAVKTLCKRDPEVVRQVMGLDGKLNAKGGPPAAFAPGASREIKSAAADPNSPLVDADRMWFKSAVGLTGCSQATREDDSFCSYAVSPDAKDLTIVPNALEDERFRNNSLVKGAPFIRFYAGAPIVLTRDGVAYKLGTLCMIDTAEESGGKGARSTFSLKDRQALLDLTTFVVDAIELGEKMRAEVRAAKEHYITCTAHDIRTPLTSFQPVSSMSPSLASGTSSRECMFRYLVMSTHTVRRRMTATSRLRDSPTRIEFTEENQWMSTASAFRNGSHRSAHVISDASVK